MILSCIHQRALPLCAWPILPASSRTSGSLGALQGQRTYSWVLQSPDLTMLLPDSCCIPQVSCGCPQFPSKPLLMPSPLPGLLYLLIFSSCFFNLAEAAQPSDLPQGLLFIKGEGRASDKTLKPENILCMSQEGLYSGAARVI